MPADVFRCEEHGSFAGEMCPDCDERGRHVLNGGRRKQLSKSLSGALRHFPQDVGLQLDDGGWADYDAVVAAATETYGWATRESVEAVVATDPKGRFECTGTADDGRIRAAYGHSVNVDLDAEETSVPATLYHGTAPRNLESILAEGLKPMSRQQVHLSESVDDARAVGQRHAADPVVLEIDAAGMEAAGHRIVKRGRETYTTDRVPPQFLVVFEEE